MLELRTLGTIDLRGDDGDRIESVLLHAKRLSLLAYLCASHPPRLHRRDTLVALLWPELDEAHARGALRTELYQLRRALGPGVLQGEGGEAVGIDGERLWSDTRAFEAALEAGRLADALELWAGAFLPGMHVDGGEEFERWLDETRDRLARRATEAARRLVAQAEAAGDLPGAVLAARRLTTLAPYDETGWQRLIALLDRSGDRAGALAAYDAMAGRLRDELEVEPSPETVALMERVRGRGAAFAASGATALGPASAAPSGPTAPAEALPAVSLEHVALPAGGPREGPAECSLPPLDSPLAAAVRPRTRRRRWLPAALACALVLAAAALATRFALARRSTRPSYTLVDVQPLENLTGDSALNPLILRAADLIKRQLADAAHVDVAEGDSADRATVVLSGRLYRKGSLVELRTQLREAGPNGRILEMPAPATFPPADPDAALDTLAAQVCVAIAFHFDPRFDASSAPGGDLPTKRPSQAAFLEYNTGAELFGRLRFREGARHLLEAYRLDPGFAKAAAFGAIALAYSGEPAKGDSIARAAARMEDAYEYDHLFAEWVIAEINGRRSDAYRAMRRITQIGPSVVMRIIAAREALWLNRPREAVDILHSLDMRHGWWRNWSETWEAHGSAYHLLGDHRRELVTVLDGRARFPEAFDVLRAEVRARAGLREPHAVLALVDEALTLPPGMVASFPPLRTTPADIAWTAAQELDEHGQPQAAARARGMGLEWSDGRNDLTRADSLLRARLLLESGDAARAQRVLARLAPFDDLESLGLVGLVAARRGEVATARQAIARLEAWPDRYVSGRHLLLAAGIQAALQQPDVAMGTLRRSLEAGLRFGPELSAAPMLRPLAGRADFNDLLRPRGEGESAPLRWWRAFQSALQ